MEAPEPFLAPDRMPTQGVRLPSRGGAAEPSALAARNTREARFSRRLAPRWVQTRSLLQKHQSDPLVESLLEDELKPIIDSLREQRRNPDPDSFPELFQTQRRVMGLIRQTSAFNDAMQQQFSKLEDQMASYEAGDENPP